MNDEITVCIGTDVSTDIPMKVLEYSILRNYRGKRRISFVALTDPPEYRELGTATGFSLQRWSVPEIRAYSGWAIYLEADQLVFGDISDLWRISAQPVRSNATTWCTYYNGRPETSVMLINCAAAKDTWPTLQETVEYLRSLDKEERSVYYSQVMAGRHLRDQPAEIPSYWNHLNRYEPGVTRLLHYTGQVTQPWRSPDHPLAGIWETALRDTLSAGRIDADDIRSACGRTSAWECMNAYWLSIL